MTSREPSEFSEQKVKRVTMILCHIQWHALDSQATVFPSYCALGDIVHPFDNIQSKENIKQIKGNDSIWTPSDSQGNKGKYTPCTMNKLSLRYQKMDYCNNEHSRSVTLNLNTRRWRVGSDVMLIKCIFS